MRPVVARTLLALIALAGLGPFAGTAAADRATLPPPPSPVSGRSVLINTSGLSRPEVGKAKPAAASSVPPPPPVAVAPEAPRIRVRTETGRVAVARLHGRSGDRISVLLPDGQLGFADGMNEIDDPFRPATSAEMLKDLQDGGFADFKVRASAHYLVLYQSTDSFAEASGRLLEDLYKNLTEALRKRDFPVHDAEFPLVAIIFRTERDFRVHKKVDPEVQAYYEIFTNRISFYQTSDRDQHSPEVAALRKPQTVAHEGTHQILQNIGIQPRLSDWPLWLVEGLAEYCSPPTMTKKGAAWGGLGQVNALHMATIRDLDDPLSAQVQGAKRPRIGRDPKTPLVEYLVTRSDLTPTDYALSWALTHYLAQKKVNEFLAYLKTMSRLPPLEKRSPEEQLADFRAAFGSDLAKMDKTVGTYLSKLKGYEPLPYYAVMFQQPIGGGMVKRATIVSQSPSLIRQWIDTMSAPNGGAPNWEILPHPSRARALLTADQWLRSR